MAISLKDPPNGETQKIHAPNCSEAHCTAIGNSGHSLNQDCAILTISLKEVSDGETKTKNLHRIGHFITEVYNQKRPHSALDYLTPVEFQRKNLS